MKKILLILATCLLSSCGGDDAVTPNANTRRADFEMVEKNGIERICESGDTIHYESFLCLRAKNTCDIYEWKIDGKPDAAPIKELTFYHDEPIGTLRVQLITRDTSKNMLSDTVVKYITIGDHKNSKKFGKFRGKALKYSDDVYEITIKPQNNGITIANFPKGFFSTLSLYHPSGLTKYYNALSIEDDVNNPYLRAWIEYNPKDNKIRIDYKFKYTDGTLSSSNTFEGVRIGD